MRFLKETIALILIIIFLIVSDVYISKYTKESISEIESKVDEIIENALSNENYVKEEQLEKVKKFSDDWKKIEDRLAYFTEHDELEKVGDTISLLQANVEADMKEDAYEKMKEIKFRIEHIKTKQKFTLNNLF